ncbi:MAG: permease-like cell division protein FtsX [Gaiellaceae bacterium]
MSRFRLLVSEALTSVTANVSTTLAATVTVLICMFMLGFVIALSTWAHSLGNHYKHELVVKVFFDPDATSADVNSVRTKLEASPLVKSIGYVSAQQGLAQMRKKHHELFNGVPLPYNPLGPAFTVQPRKGEFTPKIANLLNPFPAGVHNVTYGKKTAQRLLKITKFISIFFGIVVFVLVIAATLLVANTIRLSIFARRREIEVMKLVGASNWFVRGPFMVEGLITGLAGSIAAVILLLLGKEIALPTILGHVSSGNDVSAWPFGTIALIVIGTSLLLGAAGSGLTLRRFLRI